MPEGGGGSVHVCHKCKWAFSNPHPSPKKRAAHKKQCGRINGYPNISSLESDGEGPVGSLGNGSFAKMNLEELGLALGDDSNNSDLVIKEIIDLANPNNLEEVVNTFDGKISGQDETINYSENPLKDDDIAARQLDISIESQDNTSVDCSAMVTSTLQAKSDLSIAQKSTIYKEGLNLHSKDVLSEDSKPLIDLAISNSNLHMAQEEQDESGEEPRKNPQEKLSLNDTDFVNAVVNFCSPAIVDCSGDVAKTNLNGQDCESLPASITYPFINASGSELEILQHDEAMDHVTLFTPLALKTIDKVDNQSEVYELEKAQIKSVDEDKYNISVISCYQNEENIIHLNEEKSSNQDIMLSMSHAEMVDPITSSDAEIIKQPDNQSMVHETESTQMQIRSVDLDNGSCNILSCSPVKEKSNRLNENEGANEVHMVNVSHDIPMDPHTPFTSSLNQPGNQSVGHEQESTKIQLEFIELVKDGDDSIIPISPLVKEKDIHLDEGRNQSGGNITCAVDCDDRQSLSSVRDIIEVCKEDIQIEEVNGVTEKIGSDKLADSSVVLSEDLMEDFKVNSNDMVVSVIEPQVVEEGTSGNKGTPHLALSPEVKGEDEDEIENFTFGYCELLSTKRMKGCDENSPPNESENDSNANKSLPSSDYKNSEMQNNQNVSTEFELDTHGNETNVINNKETPQNLQNLGIGNDKVERGMEVTESISSPSKNGTISFVKVISVVDVNIPKIDADDIQIRSQSPASNRSIVSPLEVEFGTGKSEAGSSDFGNPYDQLNPKQSIGIVLGSSETIQLPISDPKSHVDTNTCFSSEKIVLSKENQPLEEISVSDGKEYSSTTSTDASEFFDASDDVVGVIESTEGHGGSESEKTEATIANPVNVANQTEEHPNESNHSITGQLSCEILPVNSYRVKKHGDGDDEEEEAQEKNKTEEIKSRVVNWQNVKDVIVVESKKAHVALKNLLGESNEEGTSSSKHTKRNSLGEMFSPPREKTTHCSSQQQHPEQKKIQTSTTKEQPILQGSPARVALANAEEVQKEWNSPARLPPINKNTKGAKTKGKPQWTPFMCCSSAVKSVI